MTDLNAEPASACTKSQFDEIRDDLNQAFEGAPIAVVNRGFEHPPEDSVIAFCEDIVKDETVQAEEIEYELCISPTDSNMGIFDVDITSISLNEV
jgi:hypothetical protein